MQTYFERSIVRYHFFPFFKQIIGEISRDSHSGTSLAVFFLMLHQVNQQKSFFRNWKGKKTIVEVTYFIFFFLCK